jgi:hypothetical protein
MPIDWTTHGPGRDLTHGNWAIADESLSLNDGDLDRETAPISEGDITISRMLRMSHASAWRELCVMIRGVRRAGERVGT